MKLSNILIVVATLLIMEFAVTLFHKYVMHGIGWGWHQSHHLPGKSARWEKNDLYAVVFASATIALFAVGGGTDAPLWWVALGITLYGLLYSILHDVLIHRRLPVKWQPKNRYLHRLKTAHHLHHAVRTREGAVSFGFLYTPPVDALRNELRGRRQES
ncbi:beta-carotene hydroxylase [Noviherbaspirillum sp.]|uniref:beta-carotene hydroxylase n=1 Tax=Noviherbaspirillum sp. TaxID=1926288 RepID=UPI002FDF6549